ncbi:MAG: helix-turn-helix transcriptional regulator [Firmicutes bacterium]|nr:helix-turn-helix transcriptional regulator [Bacillota bacterium]
MRGKLVYKWIFSYIAILLVPMMIFLLYYILSNSVIRTQASYYNDIIMQSIIYETNSVISENIKIVNGLASSQSLKDAMEVSSLSIGADYYKIYNLKYELYRYSTEFNLKSKIYIYLHNIDTIVSTADVISSLEFFNKNYNSMCGITYQEWLERIKNGPLAYNMLLNEDEPENILLYVSMLPINSKYSKKATLVVHFDRNLVGNIIGGKNNIKADYIVFDKRGNQIISSLSNNGFNYKELKKIDSDGVYRLGNTNYVVKVILANTTNFKYVCMIEYAKLVKDYNFIKWLGFLTLIAAVIIDALLIRKNIKDNYAPIKNIIKILPEPKMDGKSASEYDRIRSSVELLKSDHDKIKVLLEEQKNEIIDNYMRLLFKYPAEYADKKIAIHQMYDFKFPENNFAVMLFNIEDYSGLFGDEKISEAEKFQVVLFATKNIAEEHMQKQRCFGWVIEVDGNIALLACISGKIENADDILTQTARFLTEYLSANLKIYIEIAISNIHKNISGISKAYKEVIKVMEYKVVLSDKNIFSIEDISRNQSKVDYTYTIEKEQHFINYIMAGDFDKVRGLISEVFDQCCKIGYNDIDLARCQAFDMVGTLLKIKQDLYSDMWEINYQTLLDQLLKWKTIDEVETAILTITAQLCEKIKFAQTHRFKDIVISIIEKQYHNPNLGVAMIADILGVHRSYLSTVFKSESGMGLLEYINKYRIEKSKDIMCDLSKNLNSVALAVGYLDNRTLIRIFKKYEGITPTQYRNSK